MNKILSNILKTVMVIFMALSQNYILFAEDQSEASMDPQNEQVEQNNVEIEETLYFDLRTGEQISEEEAQSVASEYLYQINTTISFSQRSGGYIDTTVNSKATSVLAKIKSISGTISMRDTSESYSFAQPLSCTATIPTWFMSFTENGIYSFEKGHTVFVNVSFHITLLDGDVLDGSNNKASGYVPIVR